MDEVLLVVEGKTQDWRVQRNFITALMSIVRGNSVDVFRDMPLPFDNELDNSAALEMDLQRIYDMAKQSGILNGAKN